MMAKENTTMKKRNISEKQPLVSIVTPSYNQGRFIEETILSVKNQDYPNIEHIVVDGGSTDNTLEILKKYKGTYNMRWISEPDEGQSDAINKGFDMATGEILGWLNSDDGYLNRDAVTLAVNTFKKEPNTYVTHGDRVIIDENSNFKKLRYSKDFDYQKYLLRNGAIYQETILFRRKVIQHHRIDEKLQFALDIDFFLKIGKTYSMKRVKGFIGFFRDYGDNKSISKTYFPLRAKERKYLNKQYGLCLQKRNLDGGFVDLMIRKISKLLSGSYNRYINLPVDLFILSGKSPYNFTIPIHLQRKLLLKYMLSSLKPSREFFDD